MSSNDSRRGLTLIETLVVVSIVSLLVGLLLPAVQRVRAAASRSACSNNVRQLGLGLHGYAADTGRLPPGVTTSLKGEPFPRAGWVAMILPYLGESALWSKLTVDYSHQLDVFAPLPHSGTKAVLKSVACPADMRVIAPQETHGYVVGLTSYLGCLGSDYTRTEGVLFLGSRVRLGDITDGLSSTVAAGERPPSADMWYGWWYSGQGQGLTGSVDMLLGQRERNRPGTYLDQCVPGPYHFTAGRVENQCDALHFWSLHPGGANFLFCDGSVRFLAYSADSIMPALATRSGGETVSLD